MRSLAVLGVCAAFAHNAAAALPIHEALVVPSSASADNRSYTLCIKPRQASGRQCLWTLRIEEDVPNTLSNRPFGAIASDDGLRVAVVLRKQRGQRRVDELWRFHQQMNPDFAVPGTPSDETLVTRGKLIATAYPLEFGTNLMVNKFAISDGRSIQAIDDRGNTLGPLYQAPSGSGNLALVASNGALAGFVEPGADNAPARLVVADLESLGADVYSARSVRPGTETAWNLDRGWVAVSDYPLTASSQDATARPALTTLRVVDLANDRVLFETRRGAGPAQPEWVDADTLAWRLDDTHTQTRKFDARSDIRLMQGIVRAQGERLMFLPCRERAVLLVDDDASSPALVQVLRQNLASSGKLFLEAFGTQIGNGVVLDALAQAGNDANGCALKPDRALMFAHGIGTHWTLSASAQSVQFDEPGQKTLVLPYARARWNEGRRAISAQSPTVRLELTATPEACRDPGAGAVYGHRVVLRIGTPNKAPRELRGCGMFLQQSVKFTAAVAGK